jgi:hypothetical protein
MAWMPERFTELIRQILAADGRAASERERAAAEIQVIRSWRSRWRFMRWRP